MVEKIGKIIYYDGFYGKILTEDKEYIYLDKDIEEEIIPSTGEVVYFRGEEVQKVNRAYFVKRVNQMVAPKEELLKNKEKQK